MAGRKVKKKWIILLALLLAIAAYSVYLWVDFLQRRKENEAVTFIKPRVHSTLVTVNSFTKDKTSLYLTLLVDNPSPFGITIDSMSYVIYIDAYEVMKGFHAQKNVLAPGDSNKISLPLAVDNQQLIGILRKLKKEGRETVEYSVDFDFFVNLPFLKDKPLDYVYKEVGPVLIPPDISFEGITIHKISLKDASITMRIKVVNHNSFPYRFQKSFFKLKLDDKYVASSNLEALLVIPPKGEELIRIPVHFKTQDGIKKLIRAYTRPQKTSYYLYVETEILGDSPQEDNKVYFEMYDDHIPMDVLKEDKKKES
jgi:LEA14-like dessication related protein